MIRTRVIRWVLCFPACAAVPEPTVEYDALNSRVGPSDAGDVQDVVPRDAQTGIAFDALEADSRAEDAAAAKRDAANGGAWDATFDGGLIDSGPRPGCECQHPVVLLKVRSTGEIPADQTRLIARENYVLLDSCGPWTPEFRCYNNWDWTWRGLGAHEDCDIWEDIESDTGTGWLDLEYTPTAVLRCYASGRVHVQVDASCQLGGCGGYTAAADVSVVEPP